MLWKPSARVVRCEPTSNLIQLGPASRWWSLCRPLRMPFRRATPQRSLSQLDLKDNQRSDPSIREVIHQMETGEKVPPTLRQELPDVALLLREWNHLEL